jgi:uncharacterized membrane protein YhaH (DUF805 family)
MRGPFTFEGKIRRLPYALLSLGLFFSQHLVTILVFDIERRRLAIDWTFYATSLRALVTQSASTDLTLILALAYFLLVAWALAALAFRRAADADISEWIAAAAVAPIVQIPVILLLCALPSSGVERPPRERDPYDERDISWVAAAQGVVAGMALTLLAVTFGALVFGAYGFGMFFVSPLVIGAVTGYFANRRGDIGVGRTMRLVCWATLFGGAGLVVAALEGAVCIVMAAPLGIVAAMLGGVLGRAMAVATTRPASHTVSAFVLLPVVFGLEAVFPPLASFDTVQTITIDAPLDAVWRSVVDMGNIDEPVSLPFRLGMAYPVRGEVVGEGVGASRYSEFSTGVAIERVTEWIPERKLAFVVEKDVPAMRELSPYAHVHAPHVVGYFRTREASFELVAREGGRTEIVERTSHELRLDPTLYWLPLARLVVAENNARVLQHIKHRAEQGSGLVRKAAAE